VPDVAVSWRAYHSNPKYVSLGNLPDNTKLTAWIQESTFMVEAFGTVDSVAEIGEQLGWLGAALRSSKYELGVAYCQPLIHFDNAPYPVFGRPSWPDILCKIYFPLQEREEHLELSKGQCWHNMFRNPVVVQGYPIQQRSEPNTGLSCRNKMPCSLMTFDSVLCILCIFPT
jgi:hypothetical protein